ncbi:hypothetical protein N431DRAFT_472912 [Stipitochalara longipes BDJ]|nr:hypothetical protein N431DRAFT_472912 [Stipitochalara longipes BDJ]
MALSTEAIIAILAIIVNLPPTGLVIWKLFRRLKSTHRDALNAETRTSEVSARKAPGYSNTTSITIVLQPS